MDFFLTQLDKLRTDHPVFFVMFCIPIASIAINFGIWFFTSKDSRWQKILAAYPRVAALMKLCEAVGINPVRYLKWAYVLVVGKEWTAPTDSSPPEGPKPGSTYRDAAKPEPPKPPSALRVALALVASLGALVALAVGLAVAVSALAGCASGLTSAKVADAASVAECVIANEDRPVADIAVLCAFEDASAIERILSAHQLATAKKLAAKKCASE